MSPVLKPLSYLTPSIIHARFMVKGHDLPAPFRVWQHVKLSDVSLGARPRYSLVVDEGVKKPTNQTNKLINCRDITTGGITNQLLFCFPGFEPFQLRHRNYEVAGSACFFFFVPTSHDKNKSLSCQHLKQMTIIPPITTITC